jgi:hypothetical protein
MNGLRSALIAGDHKGRPYGGAMLQDVASTRLSNVMTLVDASIPFRLTEAID